MVRRLNNAVNTLQTAMRAVGQPDGTESRLFGWRRVVQVWEYERGLLYREGRFTQVLPPGRYEYWRWEHVSVLKVSARQSSEVVPGQAILTSDRVEVRISLVAQYTITDPAQAVHTVANYVEQLYQDLQLTLRDEVAARDIDTLLADRGEVAAAVQAAVTPRARTYGLELKRVGLRDVVLPGPVRDVFMKEITADREGRADLIRARHEVAATRARANAARLLSENPGVQRLQELDALKEVAGRSGTILLLPNLADLFAPRAPELPAPARPASPSNGNGGGSSPSTAPDAPTQG